MRREGLVAVLCCVIAVPAAASAGAWSAVREQPSHGTDTDGAHPKMDAGLGAIARADVPLVIAQDRGFRVRDGRIQVVIVADEESAVDVGDWLRHEGALFVVAVENLIQAFVFPADLPAIADHPSVRYVRKPLYFDPSPPSDDHRGSKVPLAVSEGLQAMNADVWHSAGFTGQGLAVAVIDSGFAGMDALVGTDLPTGDRLTTQAFGGSPFDSWDHGTACAEIVFDIVPDLEQMYLFAVSTDIDVVSAITEAQNQGVDVISMSLGMLTWGPGDGTGMIGSAFDTFSAAGGLAVVSAGNQRRSHWQGSWSDIDGDDNLDFSTGLNENFLTSNGVDLQHFPPMTRISAWLVWNQWVAPPTDLDLCLMGWDGVEAYEIDCSLDEQDGQIGQLPVESVSYLSSFGGYFGVSVSRYSGPTNVELELVMRPGELLEDSVPEGSLLVPSDSDSVLGVAALDAGDPFPLESYSAKGPTNGPGGALTGGRVKPDLAGYANVSTATYGPRGGSSQFSGTSAACPHVAGGAALVWSASPAWSNDQVRGFLESTAVDLGPAGKDTDYGDGRLWLGDPPGGCSYILSPSSADHGASGGDGSFTVSTQPECDWESTTTDGWIQITGGSSGSGAGDVYYHVDENGEPGPRTGTIVVEGRLFTVTQLGTSGCTYAISPTSQPFPISGGTGTVSVTTQSGCTWEATSDNPGWIHITSGSSGTGSGSVFYSVDANPGDPRNGTMTIATQAFTVTQEGDCTADDPPDPTFSMSPNPAEAGQVVQFTHLGTVPSVGKTNAAASSSGSAQHIGGAPTGGGDGFLLLPIGLTVSNPAPDIGESVTFEITGYAGNVRSEWDFGGQGCPGFEQPFVCDSPVFNCLSTTFKYSSAGPKTVTVTAYDSGTNALVGTASGNLTVQNAGSCGGGSCSYSIMPDEASVDAGGGTGTVVVETQAGCSWTAQSQSGWITITSGTTGSGQGSVQYSVAPNPNPSPRTGTMLIAGETFTVTQSGAGGADPATEWLWTISRGGQTVFTSTVPSFTRAFGTAGFYTVDLEASNCAGSATSTQILEVLAPPLPDAFLVPAAAHAPGLHNTVWCTDLRIFNPCDTDVDAIIEFLPDATNNASCPVHGIEFTLESRVTRTFGDIVNQIPGVLGDENKGSLRFTFDGGMDCSPLIASRTYNDTPDGTFGQFVPAVPVQPLLQARVFLTGLVHNLYYRTNIGLANFGPDDATGIVITVFDGDGEQLGNPITTWVPGCSTRQIVEVVEAAGILVDVDVFSVAIEPNGADLTMYASVVDNMTGDPVLYTPGESGNTTVWIPGIAHLPGANDSLWRSDITFLNDTDELVSARIEYVPERPLGFSPFMTLNIPPGEAWYYVDVLGVSMLPPDTDSKGYLVVTGLSESVVPNTAAKTYNLAPQGGTFGQHLKAYSEADLIHEGETAYLPGVANSSDSTRGFRTNIGMLNTNPLDLAMVSVKALDTDGELVAYMTQWPLSPAQFIQANLFDELGIDHMDMVATIEIRVLSGGPVAVYASEVDNLTQDPILVPAMNSGTRSGNR